MGDTNYPPPSLGHPTTPPRGDQMNHEQATQQATQTGRHATRLGIMLTNYDDPDCGQLIAECLRVGVDAGTVIR